jgi:hypothetical protein
MKRTREVAEVEAFFASECSEPVAGKSPVE